MVSHFNILCISTGLDNCALHHWKLGFTGIVSEIRVAKAYKMH